MAWRAFLVSINENPVPNDTATINVRFDESVRVVSFTKTYKLVAGTLLSDMKAMVRADTAALNAFETTKTNIAASVGQEII